MTKFRFASSLFAIAWCVASATAGDDLTVLSPTPDGVAPERQLEHWLKQRVYRHVDDRSAAFERAIKSERACREWQTARREFFLQQIGELPPRTPLDAQIVGTLPGDGYRIEKIVFESRPNFHVTGNLYLPNSAPPWPAVIVPCGHSHEGKAVGQYQRICILLARHGMAAFCYDPIGQGERYQILDRTQQRTHFEDAAYVPTPHPHVRFLCTTEHTLVGIGSALLGENVARYRIWDGMRAIDYLQSRKDIQADKIGCTGNSGGGTETAYLMALDDRIVAAAPGCYLTTFRKLIDTKGPQDGEQNLFGQIAFGLDEADYCILRAPRPTLICAGTRDVTFDFAGTWDLFRDAKRFYSRLGAAERMDIAAPDAPHGFTLQLREATARWMHRWLIGGDKPIREIDALPDTFTDEQLREFSAPVWTAAQLQCAPAGQVLLLKGERSAFQLNGEKGAELKRARAPVWLRLSDDERRRVAAEVIGATASEALPAPRVERVGVVERADHTIRKVALTVDADLRLPALVFVPRRPSGDATLYLHGESMTLDAGDDGPIARLTRRGHVVVAAELRGIGETDTGRGKTEFGRGRFGRDNPEIFLAYLIGKSYVGMRTDDVRLWTHALRSGALSESPLERLHLIALGEAAIPALHAAALMKDAFRSVSLKRMIGSWHEVVDAGETFDQWVNVVHGALRRYDLPDLPALIDAERIEIAEPVDVLGNLRR